MRGNDNGWRVEEIRLRQISGVTFEPAEVSVHIASSGCDVKIGRVETGRNQERSAWLRDPAVADEIIQFLPQHGQTFENIFVPIRVKEDATLLV
jgi:hypothetical protein